MYDLIFAFFSFISNQSPLVILALILSTILGLVYFIPWRSLFYYYQISEVISELETPQDIRNGGTQKKNHQSQQKQKQQQDEAHDDEIVTDDDLCIQLRDLFKHYRQHTEDVSKLAEVLTHVGIALLRHSGDPEEGIEMLEEALVLRRRVFGGKSRSKKNQDGNKKEGSGGQHILIAQSMNNLGLAYESNGKTDEGLRLQKLSLEMYQRLYENEDHEAVATAMNNVGESLIANRKNINNTNNNMNNEDAKEGILLLRKALEMRRRLYNHKTNPFHPALWRSLENLALALEHFGIVGDDNDENVKLIREEVIELRMEAEKVHEEMLKMQQKNENHDNTRMPFGDDGEELLGDRSVVKNVNKNVKRKAE